MAFIFFYQTSEQKIQWESILVGRLGWTILPGSCRLRVEGRNSDNIVEVLSCLSDTTYKATVFTINVGEIRFELN